ncbi:MAG: peptide chain release factor-like protein [Planctomycetota bacterium]
MHPSALPVEALLAECDERRLRRSGPGGQHRNKVETAVVLTHRPTGVSAEANERRSQQQNREAATHRLRLRLAVEHREPWGGSPTDRWRARLGGARLAINPANEAFPALLAEALDAIAASDWDEASAAQRLGVSRSRLLKFLAIEAEGLAVLNRHRAVRGLKPLS